MKIVYGTDVSYRNALTRSSLQRLADRRAEICKKFAIKTLQNPRYEHWFPANDPVTYDLRKREKIKQYKPNTNQLIKSPLYNMISILNSM